MFTGPGVTQQQVYTDPLHGSSISFRTVPFLIDSHRGLHIVVACAYTYIPTQPLSATTQMPISACMPDVILKNQMSVSDMCLIIVESYTCILSGLSMETPVSLICFCCHS